MPCWFLSIILFLEPRPLALVIHSTCRQVQKFCFIRWSSNHKYYSSHKYTNSMSPLDLRPWVLTATIFRFVLGVCAYLIHSIKFILRLGLQFWRQCRLVYVNYFMLLNLGPQPRRSALAGYFVFIHTPWFRPQLFTPKIHKFCFIHPP